MNSMTSHRMHFPYHGWYYFLLILAVNGYVQLRGNCLCPHRRIEYLQRHRSRGTEMNTSLKQRRLHWNSGITHRIYHPQELGISYPDRKSCEMNLCNGIQPCRVTEILPLLYEHFLFSLWVASIPCTPHFGFPL